MSKRDYWTCPLCGFKLDHGEQCDCDERDRYIYAYAKARGKTISESVVVATKNYDEAIKNGVYKWSYYD